MLLVLSNKGKGMQSSSEQPLVGEECYMTTLITAAKETNLSQAPLLLHSQLKPTADLTHDSKNCPNSIYLQSKLQIS